jgi:hypothetical protein
MNSLESSNVSGAIAIRPLDKKNNIAVTFPVESNKRAKSRNSIGNDLLLVPN